MVVIATGIISKSFFTIKNIYSFAVFLAAILFLFNYKNPGEAVFGIWLCLIGTVVIVSGYFLLKEVVETENFLVITLTSALGAMIFGFSNAFYKQAIDYKIEYSNLILLMLLGGLMFLVYKLTTIIYREHTLEKAQFFSLIAIFSTMPLESILIGSYFQMNYAIGLIIFSVLVTLVIFIPDKSKKVISENEAIHLTSK